MGRSGGHIRTENLEIWIHNFIMASYIHNYYNLVTCIIIISLHNYTETYKSH